MEFALAEQGGRELLSSPGIFERKYDGERSFLVKAGTVRLRARYEL